MEYIYIQFTDRTEAEFDFLLTLKRLGIVEFYAGVAHSSCDVDKYKINIKVPISFHFKERLEAREENEIYFSNIQRQK